MTKNGALKLGENDIGSIEIGKKANFVILEGDLEADPRVIEEVLAVFKDGHSYDPKSLISTLRGKYGAF